MQKKPWEVPDDLWACVRPLLPTPVRRYRSPGRKRLDDRRALCGVLFVLCTGLPWEQLPQELGYGSGVTCWRRLREWQSAQAWPQVREVLEPGLGADGVFDWDRADNSVAA